MLTEAQTQELIELNVRSIKNGGVPNFPSAEVAHGVIARLSPAELRAYYDARDSIHAEGARQRAESEANVEEGQLLYRMLQERYGEERAFWFRDSDPEVIEMQAEIDRRKQRGH